MRAVTNNDILAKPYWNEIKNMSDADKQMLIHLISSTMEEPVEECEDSVSEQEMEDFVNAIPAELMQAAAEQAFQDLKAGRGIPHSQIMSEVRKDMGWI